MIKDGTTFTTDIRPLVYIIGLSAKPNCEQLDPETKTGYVVQQITNRLPAARIIRTNLVRIPPLNDYGKLRYPNESEMVAGWKELGTEIHKTCPQLLVTLGCQVSSFLVRQMDIEPTRIQLPQDFSYRNQILFSLLPILPVHHPSFVLIYRRKYLESYMDNVADSISYLLTRNNAVAPKYSGMKPL